MNVDLLNTSNYEVYRRNNHSDSRSNDSGKIHNPQSKSKVYKSIANGDLLNPDRADIKAQINPQYRRNAPVAKSHETFDAVFEVIEQEVINDPQSLGKLIDPAKIVLYPQAEKSSANQDTTGKGYIISIHSDSKDSDERGFKKLKAQKRLYDKYNNGNWRQPGMLVNLSF